jgi:hypothetical protein
VFGANCKVIGCKDKHPIKINVTPSPTPTPNIIVNNMFNQPCFYDINAVKGCTNPFCKYIHPRRD